VAQWLIHLAPLHLAHLVAICLWAGVVLGEGVLELSARDDAGRSQVARAHYLVDLLLELPLLLVVLATGALLVLGVWPLSPLHWLKIGAGLIAVGVNLYCVGLVIRRQRRVSDRAALRADSQRIRWSALGVPFGVLAAVIGFSYFHV
jgi:hypothetical protein